jgi:hypothetical protein
MAGIYHTADKIAGRYRARADAYLPAQEQAATSGARLLEITSRGVLTRKIYDVPEKRSRSGRKKWRRTGRLLVNERGTRDGLNIALRNRTPYAARRRKMSPIPPQQKVDWQREAAELARPAILRLRHQAQEEALRAGGSD